MACSKGTIVATVGRDEAIPTGVSGILPCRNRLQKSKMSADVETRHTGCH